MHRVVDWMSAHSCVSSPSQEQFKKASENVKTLSYSPSNDELLTLYGLYKQSTDGDNRTCAGFCQDLRPFVFLIVFLFRFWQLDRA
jgi:hypothetical protein